MVLSASADHHLSHSKGFCTDKLQERVESEEGIGFSLKPLQDMAQQTHSDIYVIAHVITIKSPFNILNEDSKYWLQPWSLHNLYLIVRSFCLHPVSKKKQDGFVIFALFL